MTPELLGRDTELQHEECVWSPPLAIDPRFGPVEFHEHPRGDMSYDIIIRNGTVVDGTGVPGRVADVAIDGDRVVEITDAADGGITAVGRREIDATDRLVTPGFVDIHTHLDAQLAWDPIGTSTCWHGVTSVVMGNCGVTFAPVRAADRAVLAEMMESVEDIPAEISASASQARPRRRPDGRPL